VHISPTFQVAQDELSYSTVCPKNVLKAPNRIAACRRLRGASCMVSASSFSKIATSCTKLPYELLRLAVWCANPVIKLCCCSLVEWCRQILGQIASTLLVELDSTCKKRRLTWRARDAKTRTTLIIQRTCWSKRGYRPIACGSTVRQLGIQASHIADLQACNGACGKDVRTQSQPSHRTHETRSLHGVQAKAHNLHMLKTRLVRYHRHPFKMASASSFSCLEEALVLMVAAAMQCQQAHT
jgi:hypothetical protein